jgi:hypothetical protein
MDTKEANFFLPEKQEVDTIFVSKLETPTPPPPKKT